MKGNAFNALVPHYFYNCFMAFSLLLMDDFGNEKPSATLKEISIDKKLRKP